jgi:hypothetical protein
MPGFRIVVSMPREPANQKAILMEESRPSLMQRYHDSTSQLLVMLTLGPDQAKFLWQDWVPSMSSRFDFLYHAMLSASALHENLEHDDVESTSLVALEHHHISLGLFRRELEEGVNENNMHALFAFQCMCVAQCFAAYGRTAPMATLKDVLTVVRGTKVIVLAGGSSLINGPFGSVLNLTPEEPDVALAPEIEQVISELTRRIDSGISTLVYRDVYAAAIRLLRYTLSIMYLPDYAQVVMISFMLMAEQEYLSLIFMGEPLALAIFANYAVAVHQVGKRNILMTGWGQRIIRSVKDRIAPGWESTIAWALRQAES